MTQQQPDNTEIKGQSDSESTSRFDRRRFLRTSAAATPLLMAVKSPVAWGNSINIDQCSVTMLLSGNASHIRNCQAKIESPGYWKSIFWQSANQNHKERSKKIRAAIAARTSLFPLGSAGRARRDSDFFDMVLSGLDGVYLGWEYSPVVTSMPFNKIFDNPKEQYEVTFRVKDTNSPFPQTTGLIKMKAGGDDTMHVAGAILNSIFSPEFLSYSYMSPESVINEYTTKLITALEQTIQERLVNNSESLPVDISEAAKGPLATLLYTTFHQW